MSPTKQSIIEALRTVIDPDLRRDLVSLGMIHDLAVDGGRVSVRVELTTPACPLKAQIQADVERALRGVPGVTETAVSMSARTTTSRAPEKADRLPGVKNVIAVASGKGGVGKSTVAVNLAIALREAGASVGLLDADIYGPSVPIMLGMKDQRPMVNEHQQIVPPNRYGIDTISMGFLLKDTDAVVWRGPMLGKALQQFIEDVEWGEKDYLVVDLPPGTGDVQLSLTQLIPVSGTVIVTTPQDVAFADVLRAIRMFNMTNTPLLGVVENMAFFRCPDNGKDYFIFGEGRTAQSCEQYGLELLARLPLDMVVAPSADRGVPAIIAEPGGDQATRYRALAAKVASLQSILNAEKATGPKFDAFFGGPAKA
ncbi:MAG: iron-sulfur cluster carrier protein [Myxococcales bacterium]